MEQVPMIDSHYLYRGLCALARAHRANTMTGHLGAALIAGYLFSHEHPELDPLVHAGIGAELDRIAAGEEAIWFDADEAGVTIPGLFESFPEERSRPSLVPAITHALTQNIDVLRESGHNVIFAALAIRALQTRPEYATPSIIEGIQRLIHAFDQASPGQGYYGHERGWVRGDRVPLAEHAALPSYDGQKEMAELVLTELVQTASEHRQGYGGLWHLINHAAALVDLERLGYEELAELGMPAQRQHVRLYRSLPNLEEELGAVVPAAHDPRSPAFWSGQPLRRDSARLTHRIKTLYGFSRLLSVRVDCGLCRSAEERLSYLLT
jgi:hypothetical protein